MIWNIQENRDLFITLVVAQRTCRTAHVKESLGFSHQGNITDRAETFSHINRTLILWVTIAEHLMTPMRISIENGNVDEVETHSRKDQVPIEDVNISALYWTEFTGELRLHYSMVSSWPTNNPTIYCVEVNHRIISVLQSKPNSRHHLIYIYIYIYIYIFTKLI